MTSTVPPIPKAKQLAAALEPFHAKLAATAGESRRRPAFKTTDAQVDFFLKPVSSRRINECDVFIRGSLMRERYDGWSGFGSSARTTFLCSPYGAAHHSFLRGSRV